MLQRNIFIKVLFFQVFIFGIFLSVSTPAAAKTIYVKEDGDNSNDGSSDHPFKTLEKAAEEVNNGDADEVKLGKGKLSGSATFEESVDISGAGKGSTTVTGSLTFKKKVTLKNVSVHTKSKNAITLGKNSVASLENVDIRDYTGIGIWVMSGSGVLSVEDSRIGGGGGKGIYAEAGTKLTVTGTSIVNNKQEGIDIRQNTRGTIKNNSIENNSESGIELIVGSSDFVISGNDIKKNGASGIAFQFYELKKKLGTLTATGNTLSGNDKYGIDCNKPQSGDTPVGYWADSITLEGNTFSSNRITDISTGCKLVEAKTEEEEAELEKQLVEEKKTAEEAKVETTDALARERVQQENQFSETLVEKIEGVIQEEEYQELFRQVAAKDAAHAFLFGWKEEELQGLQLALEQDTNEILLHKEPLVEVPAYSSRTDLQERVTTQEEKLAAYQKQLDAYRQKKGVFVSLPRIPTEIFQDLKRVFHVFVF